MGPGCQMCSAEAELFRKLAWNVGPSSYREVLEGCKRLVVSMLHHSCERAWMGMHVAKTSLIMFSYSPKSVRVTEPTTPGARSHYPTRGDVVTVSAVVLQQKERSKLLKHTQIQHLQVKSRQPFPMPTCRKMKTLPPRHLNLSESQP
jgi:hypothetical protein